MEKKKSSICLDCKKSGGLCSWSHHLEPVEGWEAEFRNGSPKNVKMPSYRVISCPLFESDEADRITVGYLNGMRS